jgi:alginate O-acetyltransferase complex protein AlgI
MMSFTSWQFAVFTAVVFGLYYLPIVRRWQVHILVLASLIFYGSDQLQLLALLALAVLGTYGFLILALGNRRIWLPIGIAFNLALLAFFKYKFLFIDAAAPTLSEIATIDFLLRLPLPIGISFFVFHNISLLVDLTKRGGPTPTLTEVCLYIIFFPQLVSGPITRAENFLPQITPKFMAKVDFVEAAKWIVSGYFFKLFVANNLNEITTNMSYPLFENLTMENRWICLFLYSFQIYADFFGYSAVALGLGLLFGYRLPVNFNLPYIARSFSEFWTRWHISLSAWLRTYLYIPLGGNRISSARTYLNLMIVMGLGGLWHGAAISYLVWGLLHGLFLVVERPLLPRIETLSKTPHIGAVLHTICVIVVFFCVSMAWVLFKLPNFEHAVAYVYGMFHTPEIAHPYKLYRALALIYAFPVIVQHLMPSNWLERPRAALEPYLYGMMAALMLVEAGPSTSFIYFQF